LAVSEDGVHIFGILSFHVLTNPIQERYPDLRDESDIWIKSAQDCLDLIHTRANPEKLLGRCLFMADREGDEFELLHFLTENNLGFIIRSQYDRLINVDEDAVKLNELEASSVKHGKVYTVMTKVKHELKEVRVQRSTLRDVEINPPISGAQGLPSIMANVVLVKAVEGEECEIKWRLYTSEPIANADESKFIVTCYTHRWKIEEVNKGAKTGVSIEDRQFTDLDHFIPFLAVSFVVAWRIVALRTVVEVNPTVRIEEGFTEDEVAYLKAQSEERGGEMKTIKDALNLIARLGGFTGSYARPGWQILWRGWIRFYERVAGFVLAKNYDF
jgi:hypothetical protein